MKRYGWLLMLLVLPVLVSAQDSVVAYWVKFADKANSPFSKFHPGAYLSQKAIERRDVQNIPFDKKDFPVNPRYKHAVNRVTEGIVLDSKWLNGVVARITDSSMIRDLDSLRFVDTAYRVKGKGLTAGRANLKQLPKDRFQYGAGLHQLAMLNGQFLHQLGYQGQGVGVAVLDAGFSGVDKLGAFEALRANNRLGYQRNFVDPDKAVTLSGTHGTGVLSIMAARLADSFVGVAPKATYHLLKSENTSSEFLIEELAWVAAAEAADSAGAKIINSSLGYQNFDDTTTNHPYQALDGDGTLITKGAGVAADKGMLVVSSAGNEGGSNWEFITAPADGESVLTVGAVDSAGNRVGFSSVGPTADGRIKPDVMAMGAKTILINARTGAPAQSYGTSFSAPLISGMAACLWQAFPKATNEEIRAAIVESGRQATNPDTLKGYGIPDFYQAYVSLQEKTQSSRQGSHLVRIYPNPFEKSVTVAFYTPKPQTMTIRIKSPLGQKVYEQKVSLRRGLNRIPVQDFTVKQRSVYILSLALEQTRISRKLIHY